MIKKTVVLGLVVFCLGCLSAEASIQDGIKMLGEGAVEAPVGLLKLVGGLLVTVGEVIIFPFRLL